MSSQGPTDRAVQTEARPEARQSEDGAARGGGMLVGLVKLARPWHWLKNVFVLLPIPFAIADDGVLEPGGFLLGLFGFCLVNSAAYALNDLKDAAADRLHPRKKFRPMAAGIVPPGVAGFYAALLAAAGLALCWLSESHGAVVLALVYIAVNLAYSLAGKHVALVDVFLIASGFVIRVILGCFLVGVAPSNWLLLCSSSLALFLAFAKRRADLLAGLGPEHRPSLAGYNLAFLDQCLGITAGITVLAYALYTLEAGVLSEGRAVASVPFVAYGVLHYLRLAQLKGFGGSPVQMVLRQPALQVCGLGWLISIAWGLGWFG